MKILITDDFYSAYELYEASDYLSTDDGFSVEDYVAEQIKEKDGVDLDPDEFTLLGTQDTIDTEDAIKEADTTIFISDILEV
jgi:hypothetical protein